jgi:hypothetical protein
MKRCLSRFQLSDHLGRGPLRLTVVNAVRKTAVAEDLIIDGFATIAHALTAGNNSDIT